jgi:hypothetical protein
MSPCPVAALPAVVDALVADAAADLPVPELMARVAAVAPHVARLEGWLQQVAGRVSAAGAGQVPTDEGRLRSAAGWLAEVRQTSSSTAGRQLRTSAALRSLPVVAAAVLDGVLTPDQAAVLARLVGRIPDVELQECQDELVLVAQGRDPVALGEWVRHLIATHCEPALDQQAEAAREARYLQTRQDGDGTLRGRFVLATEDGEAVLTAIEALARRQGLLDDRSAGQRRADALVEVCDQALRSGELPDTGGQRAQLSYVLPADWAARRASEASCAECGPRCAEHRAASFVSTVAAAVPGAAGVRAEHACAVGAWTGPQTRARVETLLCDARITRVLLDDAGQVNGLQQARDSVTAAQRRALAARDLGCAARGCTRPPSHCDVHHLVRQSDGGGHDLGNLVLLCRRHHVLWHLGKVRLRHLHVPWHPEARAASPPGDWGLAS